MYKHMFKLKALGMPLIAALGLLVSSATNALAGEILVEGSATLATGRTVGLTQEGEGAIIVPNLASIHR